MKDYHDIKIDHLTSFFPSVVSIVPVLKIYDRHVYNYINM